MNKKGFTLIELLATIIILAIVAGITIPVAISMVNKSKLKLERELVSNVKTAVYNYYTECYGETSVTIPFCWSTIEATKTATLSQIAEYGFLSYDKTDPETGKPIIENPYNSINPNITCDEEDEECNDVSSCEIYIYNNGTYGFCAPVSSGGQICSNIPDKCKFLKEQ